MKPYRATLRLLHDYDWALVEVIQFLDSHGHSDEPVREAVDKVLNGSRWERLEEQSDQEIKQAREVLKRYEYDDEY